MRELSYERRFREWLAARAITYEQLRYPREAAGGHTVAYRFSPARPRGLVVVAHGAGNDALFSFPGLFKTLLARDFAIFTFDLDGHGRGSTTHFSLSSIASALPAALEQAHSGEWAMLPTHLLGVSFGGSLVLAALPELTETAASAVLISAPFRVQFSTHAALAEVLGPALPLTALRQREHVGWGGLIPSFGPFKRDLYPLRLEQPAQGGFGYVDVLNEALERLDLLAAAEHVRTPVLLVYGARDRLVPLEQGKTLADRISNAELLRIDGGTHLTTPFATETVERVRGWLEECGSAEVRKCGGNNTHALTHSRTHALPAGARIDVHVHLAGVGTQGSGCWTSERLQRRATFRGLRLLYGITDEQIRHTLDQDWAAMVAGLVAESELDYAVVLGFDGVYDRRGELDRERSQMMVPPRWVFEVCERYTNLLPGPSLNPNRADALERLEECIERGASLIKWLPSVQAIDPASRSLIPFYRRLAEIGIPLLVHAGTGEQTFRMVAPELGGLERLKLPLEMGVPIICAHTAAPVHYAREPDPFPELRSMLRRYPHLWVDNSGLANPARFLHLPRLIEDPLFRERMLHGSDFPVPCNAFYYARRLGVRRVRELERERNPLQRDLRIKQELGFPVESFTRAAGVLANLERWTPSAVV